MRKAVALGHPLIEIDRNVSFTPIRLGDSVSGSIVLFGPTPSKETIEAVAALVAMAGSLIPLGRAARVDPAPMLRDE